MFAIPTVGYGQETEQKPQIESAGKPAPLPPLKQRVLYDKKSAKPVRLTAKNVASDPNQLVLFFEQNPDKLAVESMPPELVLTVSQLLIQGRSWLLAEKLMFDAIKRWPERNALRQLYGRILIQLGRPKAARRYLDPLLKADKPDAISQFLYGLATWRMKPMTTSLDKEARQSFQKVLSLAPNFRDISGWTAADIRRQLNRGSSGRANMPSAP